MKTLPNLALIVTSWILIQGVGAFSPLTFHVKYDRAHRTFVGTSSTSLTAAIPDLPSVSSLFVSEEAASSAESLLKQVAATDLAEPARNVALGVLEFVLFCGFAFAALVLMALNNVKNRNAELFDEYEQKLSQTDDEEERMVLEIGFWKTLKERFLADMRDYDPNIAAELQDSFGDFFVEDEEEDAELDQMVEERMQEIKDKFDKK